MYIHASLFGVDINSEVGILNQITFNLIEKISHIDVNTAVVQTANRNIQCLDRQPCISQILSKGSWFKSLF